MALDLVIVGAGAAGLACAHYLKDTGLNLSILEARGRSGGRVLSKVWGGESAELGAEFLHGAPPFLLQAMYEAKSRFFDVLDEHLLKDRGRLRNYPDFWDEIEKVSDHMREKRKTDRSVADFLKDTRLPSLRKKLFKSFVEGFYAADLNRIGEAGVALSEQEDSGTLNGNDMFRPLPNWTRFLGELLDLPSLEGKIRYHSAVTQIQWSLDGAEIVVTEPTGEPFVQRARRVVLTIPLSILKEGRIAIDPMPEGLEECLSGLHMGHVQRLNLEFSERFWEGLSKKPVSFLHSADPDQNFSTWWTQAPVHSNVLVAWQGGPNAIRMAEWSIEAKTAAALKSLHHLTGKGLPFLKRKLIGLHTHDWSNDPFSLGAYSYAGVNGERTSQRWLEPYANTLYFAGEATHGGPLRGTVTGAIESGYRVAQQIRSAL